MVVLIAKKMILLKKKVEKNDFIKEGAKKRFY
jgi:hypothetical protein